MANRPEWFAAKRYGCGSGFPVTWQGWLILGVYGALVLGSSYWLAEKPAALASIVIPATVLLLIVCARTTRGGWHWRWGGD